MNSSGLYCVCQQYSQQIVGNNFWIAEIICYRKTADSTVSANNSCYGLVGTTFRFCCQIVQVICNRETVDCTVPANNTRNRLLETIFRFCFVRLCKLSADCTVSANSPCNKLVGTTVRFCIVRLCKSSVTWKTAGCTVSANNTQNILLETTIRLCIVELYKSSVTCKQQIVLFLLTILATDCWKQLSDSVLWDCTSYLKHYRFDRFYQQYWLQQSLCIQTNGLSLISMKIWPSSYQRTLNWSLDNCVYCHSIQLAFERHKQTDISADVCKADDNGLQTAG